MADILLVHTESSRETLIKKFKISKNKVDLIPYGPLNFLKTKNITQSEAKKYLGLKDNHKVILFFGTIRKYKGLDILIKAFSLVTKAIPEAKLVIAGKNWIDWSPYQDLIVKLNLHDKIISHIKYIPSGEIQYYFTACDVVVLPYTHFASESGVGKIAEAFDKPIASGTNIKKLTQLIKNFFSSTKISIAKKNSWDSYFEKYSDLVETIISESLVGSN
jgi:glycosyltransferase involved in cell wall biosynthesis